MGKDALKAVDHLVSFSGWAPSLLCHRGCCAAALGVSGVMELRVDGAHWHHRVPIYFLEHV